MITLSDLAYRMRDNARMFFIVTIISTVAFSAIGTLVGLSSMMRGAMDQPYAFNYHSNQGNANESQHVRFIDQTLKKYNVSSQKSMLYPNRIKGKSREI